MVATDLPRLTVNLLSWLVEHPAPGSVIPVAAGVPQTLCARYAAADLDRALALANAGRRSLRDLLNGSDALLVGPRSGKRPPAIRLPSSTWTLRATSPGSAPAGDQPSPSPDGGGGHRVRPDHQVDLPDQVDLPEYLATEEPGSGLTGRARSRFPWR